MNWKYFCGACLVVGGALFKAGAPLFALIAGMLLAATWNIMRHRGKPVRAGSTVVKAR